LNSSPPETESEVASDGSAYLHVINAKRDVNNVHGLSDNMLSDPFDDTRSLRLSIGSFLLDLFRLAFLFLLGDEHVSHTQTDTEQETDIQTDRQRERKKNTHRHICT
jgi:hypothetical protein